MVEYFTSTEKVEIFDTGENELLKFTADDEDSPQLLDFYRLFQEAQVRKQSDMEIDFGYAFTGTIEIPESWVDAYERYDDEPTVLYEDDRQELGEWDKKVTGLLMTNHCWDSWLAVDPSYWNRALPSVEKAIKEGKEFASFFDGETIMILPLTKNANKFMTKTYSGKRLTLSHSASGNNHSLFIISR